MNYVESSNASAATAVLSEKDNYYAAMRDMRQLVIFSKINNLILFFRVRITLTRAHFLTPEEIKNLRATLELYFSDFGSVLEVALDPTTGGYFLTFQYAESAVAAAAIKTHASYKVEQLNRLSTPDYAPYVGTLRADAEAKHIYYFYNLSHNPQWLSFLRPLLQPFISPKSLPAFLRSGPHYCFFRLTQVIPLSVSADLANLVYYATEIPIFLYPILSDLRDLKRMRIPHSRFTIQPQHLTQRQQQRRQQRRQP
jgi:hypothetical protein